MSYTEAEITSSMKGPEGRYLSVTKGERVKIIKRHQNGWYTVLNSEGCSGFLPSSLISPLPSSSSSSSSSFTRSRAPTVTLSHSIDPSLSFSFFSSDLPFLSGCSPSRSVAPPPLPPSHSLPEQQRIIDEQAEQQRIIDEQAEQQRIIDEQAEQQRIIDEQAEQQRIIDEQAEQQRII